jgi:hypothetical protein
LLLTFTAIEAHAQSAPPPDSPRLKQGMHVRVQSSATDTVITGKLSFIEDDSLVVAPDSTRGMFIRPLMVAIGRGDITKLEVERDEHARDQFAIALGVAGAITGAVVAIKYCADNNEACNTVIQEPQYDDCSQDQSSWTTGELIVGAGALAGMLIGFVIAPPPHWDVIALPMRDAGRNGQMHYGLRVGFRYAFR